MASRHGNSINSLNNIIRTRTRPAGYDFGQNRETRLLRVKSRNYGSAKMLSVGLDLLRGRTPVEDGQREPERGALPLFGRDHANVTAMHLDKLLAQRPYSN